MVDLQSQYQKIQPEIDSAVLSVLSSSAYINGPEVQEFQKELSEFLGAKHVIPCANGTDALQIAMMALGLQPGDEVITADFTFVATAEVIALLGLSPVLVDVDPETFNIEPEAIRKAITSKTKAIVPVHIFGQCANMDAILEIAREFNLHIIEDNAQAIGADYHKKDGSVHKAGTMGDFGCTSFFPSKNLGCYGDGGALYTNDDKLAQAARVIANHGMEVRYYHDKIGINSRLDSVQAAILRIKLRQLNTYNASRQATAQKYNKAFEAIKGLQTPKINAQSTHVFHQYTLITDGIDRAALQAHLNGMGIPAMIYYPVPLHAQKAYKLASYKEEDFKNTNHLCERVISLPMHSELDDEQIAFITEAVIAFMKKNN